MKSNDLYWVWLAEKIGIASKSFPSFIEKYPDPYEVYRLTEEELHYSEGIDDKLKERLAEKSLESAYSIVKYCKQHKVEIIPYDSGEYPQRLKTIENPPVLLYCLGRMTGINDGLCIGMVGTRKMSEYGKQTAYKISYELASANVCIVSGMALGIDGVSACGALNAGGKTIAVLGCGISRVYPKQHERLMKTISRNGAVITEFPPFEEPHGHNFPLRNRIISGLCQGVVVIEGAHGSGALITASKAVSQGRELFAIPGNVDENNSAGPNELIKNGANTVLGAEDILHHYDFLYHNVLNYKQFYKARLKSNLDDSFLAKMGVDAPRSRKAFPEKVLRADLETKLEKREEKQRDAVQNPSKKDSHGEAYESLGEQSKKVFDSLPRDKSFTPDEAAELCKMAIGEVITALTMLEISGLITSVPGGKFKTN